MGSFTGAGKKKILDGGVGTVFAKLHTAAPASGNAFGAPGQSVTFSAASLINSNANARSRPSGDISFTAAAGDATGSRVPAWIGFWSGTDGALGTLLASDDIVDSGGSALAAVEEEGQQIILAAADVNVTL